MSRLRIISIVSAALVVGATSQSAPQSSVLALVGATVIDGTGAAPLPDATVLVENGRVRAIEPRDRLPIPADAERRDLRLPFSATHFARSPTPGRCGS
jgi:hypothetical protein